MTYQRIEDYGLIGDMHTAALVGRNGSIDWLCWPHFDSPSVFGGLLDDEKGGRFQIIPTIEDVTFRQMYWPETNVLITRFLCPNGVAEIVDFMPVSPRGKPHRQKLIRRVNMVHGTLEFNLTCRPAFNYARDEHEIEVSENGVCFHAPNLSLQLASSIQLERSDTAATATFTLEADQAVTFVLEGTNPGRPCERVISEEAADDAFKNTTEFWRQWVSQCTYDGRWREMVYRSALTLKLLTFQPTGAIIAAPTCSLPEQIGAHYNLDYRYTWIREASYTVYTLLRIGFKEEADIFMDWLEQRCKEAKPRGTIQAIYGIDGRRDLEEETLDHLEGYKGSSPVRIGNAAYNQLQLDIYGALLDAAFLNDKFGSPISDALWNELRRMVDWVCDNWHRKDQGIWGPPTGWHHFVHSKMMCWIAIDRAVRLAQRRSFPADLERWTTVRDEIYEEIMAKGWNEERKAFTQHYDTETLDASTLMMGLLVFIAPDDPRMLQTIDAIQHPPDEGGLLSNSLVYQYSTDDGIGAREAFPLCTFLLVHVLSRVGQQARHHDRLKQARLMFEKMLSYTNHLGLYGEEIGLSGEILGNMPRAFTHLSLITAAYNLNKALDMQRVPG